MTRARVCPLNDLGPPFPQIGGVDHSILYQQIVLRFL